MASRKRPPELPSFEDRNFTADEIDRGIAKLQRRVEQIRELVNSSVQYNDPRVDTAESDLKNSIREVFGERSFEYNEHRNLQFSHATMGFMAGASQGSVQQEFLKDLPKNIPVVEGLIARLQEKKADLPPMPVAAVERNAVSPPGRDVFVVHGRDEAAKEAVARFLERLGLNAVILHEQPNRGQTIIEKFERHAAVGFAVVLLTPDDRGGLNDEAAPTTPRARQNVVFEFGYFIGRLGRPRVCALYKEGVELPSDIDGLVYISMDGGDGWRLKLAKEIKAAGIDVDMNLAV